MDIDTEKIDEAVLALLYLTLHDGSRAWKGLDWEAMNRLHEKGFISNPGRQSQIRSLDRERAPGVGAVVQEVVCKGGTESGFPAVNVCYEPVGAAFGSGADWPT
jgi:hypothetical protein